MTTAPRAEPTIDKSIQSLIQAGWNESDIHVFAEPDSVKISGVNWYQNSVKKGAFHNFREMIEKVKNEEFVITVQDDIEVHPDSKDFLESILWPSDDCGFVSMYSAKSYQVGFPKGINRIPIQSLWGSLFLVWPKGVLEKVLETPIFKNWKGVRPQNDPKKVKNVDTAIGKALNYLRKGMFFVNPSPVRHSSKVSSIGHGSNTGKRNCYEFADVNLSLREQVFPKFLPQDLSGEEVSGTNACYYLGGVLRFENDIFEKKPAPVFSCKKFGECVLRRIDRSTKQRCVACPSYSPTGNLVRLL